MKRMLIFLLSVLLLSACAAGGQAPGPEPSTLPESPSSAAEPAPTPSSEPAPEVSSSQPESSSVPEASSQPEKEPVPAPEPDGLPLPPQGEVNPDFGSGDDAIENPDTSFMYTPEELEQFERENQLYNRAYALEQDLMPVFETIKDSFSYYKVDCDMDSMKVILEIGVVQQDVIDGVLNSWKGDPWDEVAYVGGLPGERKKLPSVAKKEEFAAAVNKLNIAPGFSVLAEVNPLGGILLTGGLVPQEEVERWIELPQPVKDLAEKMGIPEDMLEYMPPRGLPEKGPDGSITNPDT